jgi:hypothetical protein
VLVFDDRHCLEVVAVERLVFLAGVIAASVPPGRLGVRAPLIAVAVVVAVGRWLLGVSCGWVGAVGVFGAFFGWWA